jgi:hypothetical protein
LPDKSRGKRAAETIASTRRSRHKTNGFEIAPLTGRTPAAARQLASRARRRVQGASALSDVNLTEQKSAVNAFLSALRAGDFEGLLAVLDPGVTVHLDEGAGRPGAPSEIHGAENWARGAVTYAKAAKFVQAALINGAVGLVWAPRGRLLRAMTCVVRDGKITEVDIIADPARLRSLELATLND